MSYTTPWSSTLVPGTAPANTIDDEFRELSVAIKERMETFLVKDWNADPVEPQDSLTGLVEGKKILIGGSSFRSLNGGTKATELNPTFLAVFGGSPIQIAPLILPAGVTIKLIEFLVDRGSCSAYQWYLYSIGFTTGTARTDVATNIDSVASIHVHSQAVDHTVVDSATYYISVDSAAGSDLNSMLLYGVRITYDTPDVTKTL